MGIEPIREAKWPVGDGRTTVEIRATDTGAGVVVTLLGELGPHLGAVAMASPTELVVVRDFAGHRDGDLAGPVAAGLAGALGCPVVVTAGVHIDDITRTEIDAVLALAPTVVEDVADWFLAGRIQ